MYTLSAESVNSSSHETYSQFLKSLMPCFLSSFANPQRVNFLARDACGVTRRTATTSARSRYIFSLVICSHSRERHEFIRAKTASTSSFCRKSVTLSIAWDFPQFSMRRIHICILLPHFATI